MADKFDEKAASFYPCQVLQSDEQNQADLASLLRMTGDEQWDAAVEACVGVALSMYSNHLEHSQYLHASREIAEQLRAMKRGTK